MARGLYSCRHALVILSPTFNQSKWCMKEINTFANRETQEHRHIMIPVFYGVRFDDYPQLRSRVGVERAFNINMQTLKQFLLDDLIPKVCHALNRPVMSREMLEIYYHEIIGKLERDTSHHIE